MKPHTYSQAGVDIERGDRFAEFISRFPSTAVSRTIGGFAGGIPFPSGAYRNPVLLGATDGVGTKLLVAKRLGDYSTVGIDLVAMCVNDLAVCGADPLFFLDYIACGRVHDERLQTIVSGVIRGCEIADCTLAGGETAEMPDMYAEDDVDLAGFAAGAVDAERQLPRLAEIREGDLVMGFPSSGIHSNGFSLARNVLANADRTLWQELLTPTRIYVRELRAIRDHIKAAAHITGGGLEGNLRRVVPDALTLSLTWTWYVPDIFRTIQTAGDVEPEEMKSVFNMGIGLAVIVDADHREEFLRVASDDVVQIGEVVHG